MKMVPDSTPDLGQKSLKVIGLAGPASRHSKTTLRKLPDNVTAVEIENIPSDISEDEWGEVQRFGQRLHQE